MAKSCDGCTRCCELIPVAEIGVRAFAGCPQRVGVPALRPGCAIYPDRPHSCRAWSCLYLTNEQFDRELRPDRCGVVFDQHPDIVTINGVERSAVQAWVAPGFADACDRQPVLGVVLALLDADLAILFRLSPTEAFVIFRDARGRSIKTAVTAPTETPELEDDRLWRAAVKLERHGGKEQT
jgi:hypothetical protein